MEAFRTWLLTGFAGALSATLWLGAVARLTDISHPVLLTASVVTFAILVVIFTLRLRTSQLSHAVPAVSVGYALGWIAVRNADGETLGSDRYLVGLLALALATALAVATVRIKKQN